MKKVNTLRLYFNAFIGERNKDLFVPEKISRYETNYKFYLKKKVKNEQK